jgi:hypothetical protein
MAHAERIRPLVGDVPRMLYEANRAGHNLLFEGAQGTLLDVDHGTYPYVTSSNCLAGSGFRSAPESDRKRCIMFWGSRRPIPRVWVGSRFRPS